MKQRRYGKPHYGIYQGGHYAGRKRWPYRALLILLALALIVFGVLQIVIAVHDGGNISGQPDLMVVFGCQVKKDGPSILLRDRLETALGYLEDHPDLPVLVTGGKGSDEHVSEAQAMRDYLVEHGIDESRVTMEDKSHNTRQNLLFSKEILEGQGKEPGGLHILAVSSGFHLARIEMLAHRFGYGEVSTLDAPVSHFPSAVQMFFREPLALMKSFVFDW